MTLAEQYEKHNSCPPIQRPNESEDKFNERYGRWQERGMQLYAMLEALKETKH